MHGIFDPGFIIAFLFPMMGILAIVAVHQQRMAKIVRGQSDEGLRNDVQALKQEMAYLRSLYQSQTLALESLRQKYSESSSTDQRQLNSVENESLVERIVGGKSTPS